MFFSSSLVTNKDLLLVLIFLPNKAPVITVAAVFVARNDVFRTKRRYYDPKRDILDYWESLIFCLLSYYILSKDKVLYG